MQQETSQKVTSKMISLLIFNKILEERLSTIHVSCNDKKYR